MAKASYALLKLHGILHGMWNINPLFVRANSEDIDRIFLSMDRLPPYTPWISSSPGPAALASLHWTLPLAPVPGILCVQEEDASNMFSEWLQSSGGNARYFLQKSSPSVLALPRDGGHDALSQVRPGGAGEASESQGW